MQLTLEQVTEMAPDAASAAAGKKLISEKNWQNVGRSGNALWGLCQGSSVYQVRVDFSNLGYQCSCPSRKFPCKHVLGLLMRWAASPDAVPQSEEPDWVADWLQRRKQKQEKQAEKAASDPPKKPVDEKAQQRRAAQRQSRVSDGLARFDVWLADLVRNGLATLETKPPSFWEEQAKRLVDAQAPGLASRVTRLGALVRSTPDWPERVIAELGKLKLLIHAWSRLEELSSDLQSDVRQILGWNVAQDVLQAEGEKVTDHWAVIGQWIDDEDRIGAQRSWLLGRDTKRVALVLQFSATGQGYEESILAGSEQHATVVFYPGAGRQRAKFLERHGTVTPVCSRLPGCANIDEFFETIAQQIARQPWISSFGMVLRDVVLVPGSESWFVRDPSGQALPLRGRDHWKMLAVSAGRPFDLTGEWDGYQLRPLGYIVENHYRVT